MGMNQLPESIPDGLMPRGYDIRAWDTGTIFQALAVIRQSGTLLIAILLAKSALSLEEIGLYEQFVFLGYLLTFFWLDGAFRGMVTLSSSMDLEAQPRFLSRIAGSLLVAGAGLWVLGLWLIPLVWGNMSTGLFPWRDWCWFSLFAFTYQISMLVDHVWLIRGDRKAMWRWGWISLVGLLAGLMIPIQLTGRLQAGMIGLAIFGLLRLLIMLLVTRPVWPFSGPSDWIKEWKAVSLPLVLYAIVGGAAVLVDGWIIHAWYGDSSTFAIYRYGARELPFTTVLAGATGLYLIARAGKNWQGGLEEVRKRAARLMHLFFPLTMVLMAGSDLIFRRVFSPDFGESAEIFRIFLFILASRFILSGVLMTARKATSALFAIGIAELALNACLSVWWLGIWGLEGVAWATVVAFSFEKGMHMWWIYRKWGVSPVRYVPLRILVFYTGLLAGMYLLVS